MLVRGRVDRAMTDAQPPADVMVVRTASRCYLCGDPPLEGTAVCPACHETINPPRVAIPWRDAQHLARVERGLEEQAEPAVTRYRGQNRSIQIAEHVYIRDRQINWSTTKVPYRDMWDGKLLEDLLREKIVLSTRVDGVVTIETGPA